MTTAESGVRRYESIAVFATVLRSRALLHALVAFFLFAVVELGTWVAILVYAFDQGGATAAGLVAFVQLAPAVVFAPAAATVADRMPRLRALRLAYLVFGLANVATAILLLTGQPPLVVYVGAIAQALTLTLVRPAHAAVLPEIAQSPSELTAANVATGTVENLGIIIGSIGGGLLLEATGTGTVYLAGGLAALAGAGLMVRVHMAGGSRDWVHHLGHVGDWHEHHDDLDHHDHHDLDHHDHAADTGTDEMPVEAAMPAGADVAARGLAAEMAAGLRAGLGNRLVRPLVLVVGLSFLVQGAADVLLVVLALEILHTGESGAGLLSGAIGLGGLAGAALAILLVGRRRLLGPLVLAGIVGGVGLAAPGALPIAILGLAGYFVFGSGRAVIDVVSRTLLQRVTPERYLARIFGLVEGAAMAGLAAGSLVAPALVGWLGPQVALVAAGILLPAGLLLLRRPLQRSEAAGVVHERELAAVRRIPMFALLPLTVLERLAAHVGHQSVAAGVEIITQGDPGETYYMIVRGECLVTSGAATLNRLGPGDGFGEIALLNDIPRTATVTATTDTELFVLDRHPFLEALTGQSAAYAVAHQVAAERLAVRG